MHAMGIDDAYHVERVLASGAGGTTEPPHDDNVVDADYEVVDDDNKN